MNTSKFLPVVNFVHPQAAFAISHAAKQELEILRSVAQTILADGVFHDGEIAFLQNWLKKNAQAKNHWPGNVLFAQLKKAASKVGSVDETQRAALYKTVQGIAEGTLPYAATPEDTDMLKIDSPESIDFAGRIFCVSGDFVFGPREACHAAIEHRAGIIVTSVTKKVHYMVVGSLGSPDWQKGSFGRKIETAMLYRQSGVPLQIVHEDLWANNL